MIKTPDSSIQRLERLKKRTLRSKVKKKIDEIPCQCDKLLKYESKTADLSSKFYSLQDQKFLKSLSNPTFKSKNLTFSKDYVPNLKQLKLSNNYKILDMHLKKEKNAVKKICENLNKNEMLEIGEDPAYFIVMDKQCCHKWRFKSLIKQLKKENKIKYNQKEECCTTTMDKKQRFPELMDSKLWNYESGFSITKDDIKNLEEKKDNFIKNILANNKNLYSSTITEENYSVNEKEEKTEDKIFNLKSYYESKNEEKRERFLINYKKQKDREMKKLYRFELDLSKKKEKGENRIYELKNKIEMSKLMAKEKDEAALKMIKNFIQEKKEKDEIFQMNNALKKLLTERKIKENIQNIKNEKKTKLENLKSVQSRIQQYKKNRYKSSESVI